MSDLEIYIKVLEAKRDSGELHCPAIALIETEVCKSYCQKSINKTITGAL